MNLSNQRDIAVRMIKDFLKHEASGGALLVVAALIAMLVKNSSWDVYYDAFLQIPAGVQIGEWAIKKPLILWINDGLMAIFFLLITLEMKREYIKGELSSGPKIRLPLIGAVGGMIFPILCYMAFNYPYPENYRGWAIPAATDIAFSLGVAVSLGSRVPNNLRLSLLGISIFDDLAIIVVIALFYTTTLSLGALLWSVLLFVFLAMLSYQRVNRLSWYVVGGFLLWVGVLKSGVHATLAGVLIGLALPLVKSSAGDSLAERVEKDLHAWVAYLILPIFAFANAGVDLRSLSFTQLSHPITAGIIAGMIIGKPVGVFMMSRWGVFARHCRLPQGVNWLQFYGIATLTGIGFTMSLFIGALAFSDPGQQQAVRLGILTGSLISAVIGIAVISLLARKSARQED